MFWSLFIRSLIVILVIVAIGEVIYGIYYHGKKNQFDDDE